ncbi:MAG: hypothetical protein VB092_03805 [Oscillospiraceae bacterium]|nr:hypothetical protein [Oscillospiraceae bacterium]
MKKVVCLFLCLALLLAPACGKTASDGSGAASPSGGAPDQQVPGKIEFVYEAPTAPTFAVPDNVVQQFVTLVRPFNTCPQAFTDPAQLNDFTLFFAAAGYLDGSFIASGDNYTYSISLDKFPAAIRTLFGDGAALSDDYRSNSYEPYAIDGDTVYKYGTGGLYFPFYTFAVVPLEEGYELWLLDLMDENVMNDPSLSQLVEFGEADSITWSMLEPFWSDMQTNVYTLKSGADGNYYIAGFRYENFKNVEHYMI